MLGKLFGRNKSQHFIRINFDQAWDAEFGLFNAHFQKFLDLQHLLLTHGDLRVEFENDQEKMRYLYFITGAADRLSRSIEKTDCAQMWWASTSLAQGTVLLGDRETAFEELKRYGNETNKPLFDAGQMGWEAMSLYVKGVVPEATTEDKERFSWSGAMLTKVVRDY
jgi:hypothetical protein